MQDPRISAALSVMMGINLMGEDDKMDTDPSPPSPPKQKREPTPPPPEKSEDESLTEEQKEVITTYFKQDLQRLKLLYSVYSIQNKKGTGRWSDVSTTCFGIWN